MGLTIGFDISQTGESKAGCGYFAYSLIQALAECDDENEYVLYPTFGSSFWDPNGRSSIVSVKKDNFRLGLSHSTLEEMRNFWLNPAPDFESKIGQPQVIHANNFFCPRGIQSARVVYTLYDLGFLHYPEFTTEMNRITCFSGVFDASLYADFIIAISEHSRKDFLDIFPHYPKDRVVVVHLASRFKMNENLRQPESVSFLRSKQFWLNVGTIEPRKNHRRLVRAYAKLCSDMPDMFPLVLAGGKGWMMDDLVELIEHLSLGDRVILLGYVDDLTLQWLYQSCFAFVYPSLFEGFGLPVLEALNLGAPVITSGTSSLPEVVGDAGILVDPEGEHQIYSAMRRLIKGEVNRQMLIQRGLDRARQFSWATVAKAVKEIYEQVGTGTPRRNTCAANPAARENRAGI